MMTQLDYKNSSFQNTYAQILNWGSALGLICMLITFALYAFGILEPLVSFEKLPEYWSLPLSEYLEKSGAPAGWGWVENLSRGDYSNYIGIAILTSMTFVCYIGLFFDQIRQRKILITILVVIELVLFIVASSNLLFPVGH
ncbi:MAG: hypothetical protein OEY59_03845 [Deltaproteobacteria bacterium]|nr:hypothetical protein [Deltaproteobacteria bacterium]